MKAGELSEHASKFANLLGELPSQVRVTHKYVEAEGKFIDVYRREIPAEAGVYWFYIPGNDVFYIGMSYNSVAESGIIQEFHH